VTAPRWPAADGGLERLSLGDPAILQIEQPGLHLGSEVGPALQSGLYRIDTGVNGALDVSLFGRNQTHNRFEVGGGERRLPEVKLKLFGDASIARLRSQELRVQVAGPSWLEGLSIRLSLRLGGKLVACQESEALGKPPTSIQRQDPVWEALAHAAKLEEQDLRSKLDDGGQADLEQVELVADLWGFARDHWTLEGFRRDEPTSVTVRERPAPVSTAEDALQEPQIWLAEHPLESSRSFSREEEFRLEQPVDAQGWPVLGEGRCTGPRAFRPGEQKISRPRRLLRQLRGSKEGTGCIEVVSTAAVVDRSPPLSTSRSNRT